MGRRNAKGWRLGGISYTAFLHGISYTTAGRRRMSFALLTDDALCEVAKGNIPLLLALQATCKDARRVLSSWLKRQVSVRLQVTPSANPGPDPNPALSISPTHDPSPGPSLAPSQAFPLILPLPLTSTDASRPAASPRRSAASPPPRSRGCARSAYTAAASQCGTCCVTWSWTSSTGSVRPHPNPNPNPSLILSRRA